MDNFWTAEDKIPISQKRVSVPSQNGLEYSGGQRVVIEVPPTIQFIQPRESYLTFDVKINVPASVTDKSWLQLDEVLGAQSLISQIQVYSGGAGKILLEEIQGYNILTNVKYMYETNDVIRHKRSLTEGSTAHSVENRSTCGTSESHKNVLKKNPYFTLQHTETVSDDDFVKVKVLLPLNTGLFSSSKVLPVMLMEGLVLDIILEDTKKVIRKLDTSMSQIRLGNCPVFHSINGSTTAPAPLVSGTGSTTVYVTNDNSVDAVDKLPFGVGDMIGFTALDGTHYNASGTLRTIASVALSGDGLVEITFDGVYDTDADVPAITANAGFTAARFSNTTAVHHLLTNTGGATGSLQSLAGVTYTISDVEMRLQQLEMPQGYVSKMMSMMKEGGSMNYDFMSFTNYKYSQLSSDIVANIRLPISMSRCKAILAIPTDATTYSIDQNANANTTYEIYNEDGVTTDVVVKSDKSSLVGISDGLKEFQWFYDGKLNPSRKISCEKTSTGQSISQQHLIELEKSLVQSGITPYSFRAFRDNFVVGRALSLHNGIYDARGRDFNLQVEYGTQTKNKLWNCFVSHIRRIVFSGSGISLSV